jgi:hypothetical protein
MIEDDEDYWEIPDNIDRSSFDFTWRPDLYEPPYIHQFPIKSNIDGGPRYIAAGATDIKYHTEPIATIIPDWSKWWIPDTIDRNSFDFTWEPDIYEPPYIHQFPTKWANDAGPRYIATGATDFKYHDEPVADINIDWSKWWIPDNIDCSNFDFTWVPGKTDRPYIYQFGTQHQKTGGPRYIQPGSRRFKYESSQHAIKLPDTDNWVVHPDLEVIDFDWSWHPDSTDSIYNYVFGTRDIPPQEINLITYKMATGAPSKYSDIMANARWQDLDIIFVSNGEVGEQQRYDRLCEVAGREVKWVRGVNGRENALSAAAQLSTTQWFILFPGKLWADAAFDFNFQPNRTYEPKHYIFYAKNPLNGLEYGHQAAVCYNRQLVLETINYGLDFTMSKLHDIVPVLSGVAQYNSSVIMTWRTAFREVIKLLHAGDAESAARLEVWRTVADGENAEWSIAGANDALDYYTEVSGDISKLMDTFSWQWLEEYFNSKYSLTTADH